MEKKDVHNEFGTKDDNADDYYYDYNNYEDDDDEEDDVENVPQVHNKDAVVTNALDHDKLKPVTKPVNYFYLYIFFPRSKLIKNYIISTLYRPFQ